MKILFALVLLIVSINAQAAGIRWRDHYPFHKPDRVVVGEYLGRYEGPAGVGGTGYLKGKSLVAVDGVQTGFNSFRFIPLPDLAGIGLSLVKRLGPAMIVSTLAPLIWDAAQGIWVKLNSNQNYNSGNVYNGTPCLTTPIDHVVIGNDGSACTKRCYCQGLSSPWVQRNSATNDSENRTGLCVSRGCSSLNWPVVWARNPPPAYEPTTTPATDADILAALNNYLSDLNNFMDFINKLDLNGLLQAVYNASNPHHLDGPASTTRSNTVVSNGPDGQTTTQTDYQYNYTYNDYSVTLQLEETVTVTHPDNTTTTTTNIYEGTSSGGDNDSPPDSSNPADICAENPEIMACWGAGTIEEQDIPEIDKSLTISSEKTSAGSCPASIQFTVRGHSYTVSWEPLCTFASTIRPLVILMAWLTAGIFVFYTLSRA